MRVVISIRSRSNWVHVAFLYLYVPRIRESVVLFLPFFFTAYCILSLVEWPAPHGLLYPMDPCTAPCNKYGIFRPRNKSVLHGAQGQEMDTYFDITTAYYSSRYSSLTCSK